jgi:UDP-glucose 4-epimerase
LESEKHRVIKFDIDDGDLKNENALDALGEVDFVYHLAARTFVPGSWETPHSYYANNIMGTITVLEFCRRHTIPLVFLSTYIYGTPQRLPIDETHPLSTPSPYHMSKLSCEELCAFYASKYQICIRVLRPFNVYGAGQSDAFLLPKIMRQILSPETKTIEIFDLSPKRDYIYIEDLISAMLLAQKKWEGLEIFNVGTGVSISVKEAIETMLRETGCEKDFRETGERRQGEIDDCRADISKVKNILGFTPKFSFANGIKKWFGEVNNA